MTQSELLQHWPHTPDGQPEQAVHLEREADFPAYSGIHCSMLEAYGIPYLVRRSGTGQLGLVYGGFSPDGVDIYVPASLAEDATTLLTQAAQTAQEE